MAFVRVKDTSTGHEYTVDEGALVEGLTVLKKDAVDRFGEPLPAKPKAPLPKSAAASKSGGSDAEPKEK